MPRRGGGGIFIMFGFIVVFFVFESLKIWSFQNQDVNWMDKWHLAYGVPKTGA